MVKTISCHTMSCLTAPSRGQRRCCWRRIDRVRPRPSRGQRRCCWRRIDRVRPRPSRGQRRCCWRRIDRVRPRPMVAECDRWSPENPCHRSAGAAVASAPSLSRAAAKIAALSHTQRRPAGGPTENVSDHNELWRRGRGVRGPLPGE